MKFSLVRPDFAFISVWLVVLALYFVVSTPLNPPFETPVAMMLGFNLLIAPVIVYGTRYALRKRGPELSAAELKKLDPVDVDLVWDFTRILFVIWSGIYAVMVIYSGGFPLLWAFMGIKKTYLDFGIPSIGGLNYMIRNFLGVVWVYLFLVTRKMRFLFYAIGIGLLCVLEVTRGGLFIYLLHVACVYLLVERPRIRTIFLAGFIGLVAIAGFVALGSVRGLTGDIAQDYGADAFANLPAGLATLFWVWIYAVTPIANVNHAAALGITPNYLPIQTLTAMLPTAIRAPLGMLTYPIPLIVESFNATSAYAPLVADFGFVGAALLMALFQIACTYVYVRAKQGSLVHLLFYPPLFVSIVLGIFFLYAANWIVLMFPWLCLGLRNYVVRRKRSEFSVVPEEALYSARGE